jgi:hypothetical protein
MKTYGGMGSIAPRIHNLITRLGSVSFTLRFGRCGKEKLSYPSRVSNPYSSVIQSVT